MQGLLKIITERRILSRMDEKYKNKQCENCHKELELGFEFIATEKSVVGPRGVVPLGDLKFFCDEKCVNTFFGDCLADDFEFSERAPY